MKGTELSSLKSQKIRQSERYRTLSISVTFPFDAGTDLYVSNVSQPPSPQDQTSL